MVFGSWVAEVTGFAPVNVHALEVKTPSAVALSRSAAPLSGCPVPLCMLVLRCVHAASKEVKALCVARGVRTGGTPPRHLSMGLHNMHRSSKQRNSVGHLHPGNIRNLRFA